MNELAETLYLVIPCYNEEEMLPITAKALMKKMDGLIAEGKVSSDSKVMFVDDGSKDNTWEVIQKLHDMPQTNLFTGIKLSRNKGHQNALLAGLMTARKYADILISMDADLQDDINAIDGMLEKRAEGCEIVYGVRSSRETDTAFKRNTARSYYKMLEFMGVEITYDHADYRLMSKIAVEELSKYTEVNVFLRGMVPLLGYKTTCVYYSRSKREAGESKYPLKKMLSFAFDGITSFSIKPINMIVGLGIFVLFVCILAAVYAFISYFTGNTDSGWTSLILSIWFIGGIQLLSIGVIGQYIGKIYKEVKRRPKFNIETVLDDNNKNN